MLVDTRENFLSYSALFMKSRELMQNIFRNIIRNIIRALAKYKCEE
jgi:hypothetical protein